MKRKSLKIQTFVIYLAAIVISISSLYLSHQIGDWQWFSRAGSIIVVLGIYLTSSQIIENSRRLRFRYPHAHKEGNFQRDWAKNKHVHILGCDKVNEEETWVMGKCGFNLLIIGTLIWGFGDLIGLGFL